MLKALAAYFDHNGRLPE
jgi:aubergine-like protein